MTRDITRKTVSDWMELPETQCFFAELKELKAEAIEAILVNDPNSAPTLIARSQGIHETANRLLSPADIIIDKAKELYGRN